MGMHTYTGRGEFSQREEEIRKRDFSECIYDLVLAFFLLSSVALITYDIRENYVRKVDMEIREMERVQVIQNHRRENIQMERQEIEKDFKELGPE